MLKADRIADLLENPNRDDPLIITPQPRLGDLRESGTASIDLRLGTWFLTLRQSRFPLLDVSEIHKAGRGESRMTKRHYIPFGSPFILHPRCFVPGATLEWIRFPRNIAGYVVGKSSWGRRGLVIATATGVHPGFAGCLTLEITNLGEMPIAIKPGMQICQICLHEVQTGSDSVAKSPFACNRRPTLGIVNLDAMAQKLSLPESAPTENVSCAESWHCPMFVAGAEKQAIAAAYLWLSLIDGGKFAESWNSASEYRKNAVTSDDFVKSCNAVRKPLGTLKSRDIKAVKHRTSLPEAPDGEYVVIQFRSVFDNKKSASETVTQMLESDGKWRTMEYDIK